MKNRLSLFLILIGFASLPPALADQTIEGQIHDLFMHPIVGASVSASIDGRIVASASTDENGIYTLVIPEKGYTLRVEKTGYLPTQGRPRNNDFFLEAAGSPSGAVTRADDVTPIVGASVRLRSVSQPRYYSFGKTDSEGRYAIRRIDPASYTVEVYHPDFQFPEVKSDLAIAGPVGPCDFRALAFGKISGRVVCDQTPVKGVFIEARLDSDPKKEYDDFTNADGMYTIKEVPPGTYTLSTISVDHRPAEKREVVVADAVSTDRIDFSLSPSPRPRASEIEPMSLSPMSLYLFPVVFPDRFFSPFLGLVPFLFIL